MAQAFSKLFRQHTLKDWGSRSKINYVEQYLFDTYFTDSSLSVLEAGTGGGVVSFYLEHEKKFKVVTAFDIIPEMILKAQTTAKSQNSNIHFLEGDACDLSTLQTGQFDYLIYMQQILCMIPQTHLKQALQEAYRLGAPDSIYLFSFLDWDSRWYNPILSFNVNAFRFFKGLPFQKYYLPEVKFHGSINWRFYSKNQHALLWGKKDDLVHLLKSSGFAIEYIYKNESLIHRKDNAHYFVCKKKGY
ncbi:MAG: class I SAM-dependent methyltransferase [Flavobacteriaceae bacterium]|nr:class I SAM-dependent methyltransferase [Flavobacteriaceae bacterium]